MKANSEPVASHAEIDEGLLAKELEAAHKLLQERKEGEVFKAYLFTVKTTKDSEADVSESLAELERLLHALGDKAAGITMQRLAKIHPPTLVGSGKALEIAKAAQETQASYVVCDRDLSPSQARNLEAIIRLPVLDRSGIILQIFERNARTREARIQVGIAHLEYLQPRLASSWISWERQGGGASGGGAAKSRGSGEKQKELDARLLNEKLTSLRRQLEEIKATRQLQRKARNNELKVSLVGYTNAGKTTLMNALTESSLSVRDGLFETLDSTVRSLRGGGKPKILVSDTVGFIRNLPHSLVASFRSTLEEISEADLLLHVLDSSSERALEQWKVTNEVLTEIGAASVPQLVIFNKCDKWLDTQDPSRETSKEKMQHLKAGIDNASHIFISAKNAENVALCIKTIEATLYKDLEERSVFLTHTEAHLLGPIYAETHVLSRKDDEEGTTLSLKAHSHVLNRLFGN